MTLFYLFAAAFISLLVLIVTLVALAAVFMAKTLGDIMKESRRDARLTGEHLDPANLDDPISYQMFHADDRIDHASSPHENR